MRAIAILNKPSTTYVYAACYVHLFAFFMCLLCFLCACAAAGARGLGECWHCVSSPGSYMHTTKQRFKHFTQVSRAVQTPSLFFEKVRRNGTAPATSESRRSDSSTESAVCVDLVATSTSGCMLRFFLVACELVPITTRGGLTIYL